MSHQVCLPTAFRCDLRQLAHEVYHTLQWDQLGSDEYLWRGIRDQLQYARYKRDPKNEKNPYTDPKNDFEHVAQEAANQYSGPTPGCT